MEELRKEPRDDKLTASQEDKFYELLAVNEKIADRYYWECIKINNEKNDTRQKVGTDT